MPVSGGQQYDLSFAHRSEGMVREQRHGRPGYAAFSVWIFWVNDKGGVGHVWAYRRDAEQDTWQRESNPRARHTQVLGLPYTAPEDATHAQIRLQLVVNAAAEPRVYVDQVEFAPVAN